MNWTDRRKLDRLVELKAQIKPLEAEAKQIQDHLVKTYGIDLPKLHETRDGKIVLSIRQNFTQETGDINLLIIEHIGQKRFNEEASMSMTKIKGIGGQVLIKKLIEDGVLKVEAPTLYYSFKTTS